MITSDLFKCIDCKIPVPQNKIICVVCENIRERNQKRVQLTHGSARVEENCSPETIKALDEMSKLAYNMNHESVSAYQVGEIELTFLDYADFKEMTAVFRFISFEKPEIEHSEIVLSDWRSKQIKANGFDRFSGGKNKPTTILIDYDNLTIGRISKISCIITRADVEKVADFIYEQKMLIVEKEICSLIGEIDFEANKGFYDELK